MSSLEQTVRGETTTVFVNTEALEKIFGKVNGVGELTDDINKGGEFYTEVYQYKGYRMMVLYQYDVLYSIQTYDNNYDLIHEARLYTDIQTLKNKNDETIILAFRDANYLNSMMKWIEKNGELVIQDLTLENEFLPQRKYRYVLDNGETVYINKIVLGNGLMYCTHITRIYSDGYKSINVLKSWYDKLSDTQKEDVYL